MEHDSSQDPFYKEHAVHCALHVCNHNLHCLGVHISQWFKSIIIRLEAWADDNKENLEPIKLPPHQSAVLSSTSLSKVLTVL